MDERATRSGGWSEAEVLELVAEHERVVRAYLLSLGCAAERAEDLAQETFLRLFRRPEPQAIHDLRAYLCVTARNLYGNGLRREEPATDPDLVEAAWVEFDPGDGGSAYLEALGDCLERLPARTREALRLRYGTDVPRGSIASRLRLSLGGVKSLLQRGKEELRGCIERKLGLTRARAAEVAQ